MRPMPDSSGHWPVPGKMSAFFFLLISIAMRTLRDLYLSIPLSERTPRRPFLTLVDICPLSYLPFSSTWPLYPCGRSETYTIRYPSASGLQWDPSRLWRTSARWGICLFHPADLYSYVDASRAIPCNSPRRAESNALCPDIVRLLVSWLSILWYFSSPPKYFQIVSYRVLLFSRLALINIFLF